MGYMDVKNSEKDIGKLSSSNPVVLYQCKADPEFPITFVSRNVRELTGYSVEDYFQNRSFGAAGFMRKIGILSLIFLRLKYMKRDLFPINIALEEKMAVLYG